MSMGSLMSGLVLNNSGTSLVHALAYPIGGEFHTPHGLSLTALILPCFEYIAMAKLDNFVCLAEAIGEPVEGLPKREVVAVFLDALRDWMVSLGLPVSLGDIGITDRSKVTHWAVEGHNEKRLLSRCARNLTVKDCETIYSNAL
jgi:alcohol dehydrogenase class IV